MTWLNDAELTTPADMLESARAAAISTMLAKIDEFGRRFTKETPRIEQDGWTAKAQAAHRLLSGDETPGMIHAEAAELGIPADDLARKVLEKSEAYMAICALISAIRSKTLKQLKAATTRDEIDAVLADSLANARTRAQAFGVDFP